MSHMLSSLGGGGLGGLGPEVWVSRKLKAWEHPEGQEERCFLHTAVWPAASGGKSSHLKALLSLGLQVAQAGVGATGKSWSEVRMQERERRIISASGTGFLMEIQGLKGPA